MKPKLTKILTSGLLAAMALMLCAASEPPRVLGPYTAAMNFPADITGVPDTRPTTWGLTGYTSVPIPFHPPAGYRVRVLKLEGNYMAGTRGAYAPGSQVGTSWGILTSAPGGSNRVDFAADNCFAWLEYYFSNNVNQPFSLDTHLGGLLEADNVMTMVLAVYLNDQPFDVHQEVTFIATYQFERVP